MKRALVLILDYFSNALKSAAIGALMAVLVVLARGDSVLSLSVAAIYALIGAACGTCSKAAIEGAFALFGKKRFLAYLLNALVIATVILVLVYAFLGGFSSMEAWAVILVFALPEAASVFLVRAGIDEATRLEHAFARRRKSLDSGDED
jgi:hypothetical protein